MSQRDEINFARSLMSVFIDQYLRMLETNRELDLFSQQSKDWTMFAVGSETFCRLSMIHDTASAFARNEEIMLAI